MPSDYYHQASITLDNVTHQMMNLGSVSWRPFYIDLVGDLVYWGKHPWRRRWHDLMARLGSKKSPQAEAMGELKRYPWFNVAKELKTRVEVCHGNDNRYFGTFRTTDAGRRTIIMRSWNYVVWCHELCHAADFDLDQGNFAATRLAQTEIVACLGAAILLELGPRATSGALGYCWAAVKHHARPLFHTEFHACEILRDRTCRCVAHILKIQSILDKR